AIDLRLGGGALNFLSPDLIIKGSPLTSGVSAAKYTQFQKKASAWTLAGGLTFKYEFRYGWVILMNADYLRASVNFNEVQTQTEIEGQGVIGRETVTYTQKFQMLLLTTGVGLVF